MANDTPEPSERKRWRTDVTPYGGPCLIWPSVAIITAQDLYELPSVVVEETGEDEVAAAHAALVECVRKAEVYDRIAEIVAPPMPEHEVLRSARARRYQHIAALFPEAD